MPNTPPVADAGLDQNAFVGSTVTLDGRLSSDANGDPRTYLWTLASRPPGSGAALSDPTGAQPVLVPDVAGTYVASLRVNDGTDSSAPDSVTITATPNPWGTDVAMPTSRSDVAAVAIGSTIYVLGGSVNGTPTGIVEIFDTTTHTWSSGPAMLNARSGFAVAASGTKIYAIGGGPIATNGPLSSVEELDTTTGIWAAKAPMPIPRTLASAAALGGTIYVVGGAVSPGGCIDWVCKGSDAVEAYQVASNTWTTLTSLPRRKIGPAAVALGNAIYALGGEQQGGIVIGESSASVYRYDVGAAAWTTVAPMPIASSRPPAVEVDGKANVPLASTLRYDPAADTWTPTEAPPLGSASRSNAATVGGKVYIFDASGTFTYEPALDRP